jgi:ATP-dependent exoDNAse (exonuclease V) beta subunit
MRYGTAFHMLMQHAHAGARFDPQHWTGRLGLPLGEVAPLCRQADALLVDSSLTRFFNPGSYERALNEWPFVTESGTLLRVDRLVEFPAEVWVLDYKTGGWSSIAGTPLEGEYRAQVAAYCNAVRAVFPAKTVYGLLLFADGSRVTIEECADE